MSAMRLNLILYRFWHEDGLSKTKTYCETTLIFIEMLGSTKVKQYYFFYNWKSYIITCHRIDVQQSCWSVSGIREVKQNN